MGTRHHIIVTDRAGVVKVRQYAQWDGYFHWNGKNMLELISTPGLLDKLETKLEVVELLQDGDPKLPTLPTWYDIETWYSRDLSWKILQNIVTTDDAEILLIDCDGPFEEYSYHLDYAARTWTATKHLHPNDKPLVYSIDKLPTIEAYLQQASFISSLGD